MMIGNDVHHHIVNRGLESTVGRLDVNGTTVVVEFDEEVCVIESVKCGVSG